MRRYACRPAVPPATGASSPPHPEAPGPQVPGGSSSPTAARPGAEPVPPAAAPGTRTAHPSSGAGVGPRTIPLRVIEARAVAARARAIAARVLATPARLRVLASHVRAVPRRTTGFPVRMRAVPVRARLVMLALALVLLGLAVSDTVVLHSVRGQMVARVDGQLQRFAVPLARRLGSEGIPRPRSGRGSGTVRAWLPSQFVVALADADGRVAEQFRRPVAAGDPRPLWPTMDAAGLAARMNAPFDVASDHGGGRWRVLIVPVRTSADGPADTSSNAPAGVVVAASLDGVSTTTERLSTAFVLIGAVVAGVLGIAGWFAVRAGLRPLRRIEQAAAEIAAGRPLSYRMPPASPRTEAGRLTTALNGMLAQIESAFAAHAASEERMRRFVADAGHELRTPLASIRGFAELHRMGALSGEADVARSMARIESEAVRLGGIVEDLLTLVRLDQQRPLRLAPMDLRTLAVDALHDAAALDPAREVTLTGPGGEREPGPAPVTGDEARLRQVVANLVGNAIAHTPPGTPVRIGVGTCDGYGVLEVADAGPGIPPGQAARVFERFYRVDVSRSRHAGGGAGLGLSIAAALAAAHGGHITLTPTPVTGGATFRLHLPTP